MSTPTRDIILRTLRSEGECTVKELAAAADVSPVSVRHHLSNLQAEGLVSVEEVRHGVGRPHHSFSLTEKALELFPTRYYRLTNRLLVELKENMPDDRVDDLFSGVADNMAQQFADELQDLPLEERLQRLVELLKKEGFDAELEKNGDQLLIHELSCPYLHVGQEHPEICVLDQSLIAKALSLPVERVTWLLEGDLHCTYAVDLPQKTSLEEVPAHE
ncbi:MAG: ArsR family transcriptional regulator [Anaerolineales bacterium]|nr:ArsR family transcriptional regulator [Anaerolineales bacterium]